MARKRWSLLLALVILPVSGVEAGEVAVRYLVERTPIRTMAATATITVELHADAACAAPIAVETLALGDLGRIADVKRIKLRGARPLPRAVELRHVVNGVPARRALYARVVGDGVVPMGVACQVQAFVPPPPVVQPIARDAEGTPIGVVSVTTYLSQSYAVEQAVLGDDGYGVYALAVGSRVFVAFDWGLMYPTPDCSGPPYSAQYGVFAPAPWDEATDVIYGPSGPAVTIGYASWSDVDGCSDLDPPGVTVAAPVAPLGLERFVPPFFIDHAPPAP